MQKSQPYRMGDLWLFGWMKVGVMVMLIQFLDKFLMPLITWLVVTSKSILIVQENNDFPPLSGSLMEILLLATKVFRLQVNQAMV